MLKKNIPPLVIAIIILLLSLSGAESFGKMNFLGIRHADKVVHAGMYFVLTYVLLYQNRSIIDSKKSVILFATIPLIFGTIIEFLQSWLTTSRRGDLFDLLFNIVGIFLAIAVWRLLRNMSEKEV